MTDTREAGGENDEGNERSEGGGAQGAQELHRHAARDRDAGSNRHLPWILQERDHHEPGEEGVLESFPPGHAGNPARPRSKNRGEGRCPLKLRSGSHRKPGPAPPPRRTSTFRRESGPWRRRRGLSCWPTTISSRKSRTWPILSGTRWG